jgi:hypothetical protein
MNVVDSSGWLEYFTEGPNASFFASAIEDAERLLVPTARIHGAAIWTQDADFKGLEDVKYVPAKKR